MDEVLQGLCRVVRDRLQPDTPGPSIRQAFNGTSNENLALVVAPLATGRRVGLGAIDDQGLVDLDHALERLPVRIDHAAAELMEEEPSALVGADPELAHELQGGNAVGARRNQVRREEPRPQRQVRTVRDRAGRHRGLPAAAGALPVTGLALELPAMPMTVGWADEPFRPAFLSKPVGAGRIVREIGRELLQRRRSVVRPATGLVMVPAHAGGDGRQGRGFSSPPADQSLSIA